MRKSLSTRCSAGASTRSTEPTDPGLSMPKEGEGASCYVVWDGGSERTSFLAENGLFSSWSRVRYLRRVATSCYEEQQKDLVQRKTRRLWSPGRMKIRSS
jgi:hypothetical protein